MIGKIKIVYSNFKKALLESKKQSELITLKTNDIQASVELLSLGIGFIPKSSYSMSPTLVLHLLNDVIINKRKSLIEFGSGISTVYLAKIIKDNNLDCIVYSIDEDEKWQALIKRKVDKIGLGSRVKFITAPLTDNNERIWYDENVLSNHIDKKIKFDCVIVDAPSTKKDAKIRYWAIPYLLKNNLINSEYIVFVDDTFRESEYISVLEWNKLLTESDIHNYKVYCTISKGLNLVSRPIFQGHDYRLKELYRKIK